jgi:N-acetyl-gamma-glutamyl-phosphate reductase
MHRHQKEIEKIIGLPVQFTPHLVPMKRGILASSYIPLKKAVSSEDVWALYNEFYEGENFIRLLPLGQWPKTAHVSGSNYCDIGLGVDSRTNNLLVVSAIDNLVKGAAGQAVQNMNIMMKFPESMSLQELHPIFP